MAGEQGSEPQISQPSTACRVTRRQALNACDACRQRKTRCDENKPVCGRCNRLSLSCIYIETNAVRKFEASVEATSRLSRIEELLESLNSRLLHWDRSSTEESPLESNITGRDISPKHAAPSASPGNSSSLFLGFNHKKESLRLRGESPEPRLAIPSRHSTAAEKLLKWPCSPTTVSDSDLRYPIALEICRSKYPFRSRTPVLWTAEQLPPDEIGNISLRHAHTLIHNYTEYMHPHAPIFNESVLHTLYLQQAMNPDFSRSLEACIVLIVFALGELVSNGQVANSSRSSPGPASEDTGGVPAADKFFGDALRLFENENGVDWTSVQCLLLIGQYYSANLRVLDHWTAVNKACSTIMLLLPLQEDLEPLHIQLYWVAYMHESQLLAEFDFPPSGISRLENAVPLPYADADERGESHLEYRFFFLAQIALRRLLNRIHHHLYNIETVVLNDGAEGNGTQGVAGSFVSSPQSIVHELDHQLETWRASLPSNLQFPKGFQLLEAYRVGFGTSGNTHERLMGNLRARYCAAKSIIHRPLLYRALHCQNADSPSEDDKQGTSIALGAALAIPLYSGILYEPISVLPHPINPCRSFFAAAIQVSFVSRHPKLSGLLPPESAQIIDSIQHRLHGHAAWASPVVARDLEHLVGLRID